MKNIFLLFIISLSSSINAQNSNSIITKSKVRTVINTLASNDMEGRQVFTPGIDKAAAYIASEYKKIRLTPYSNSISSPDSLTYYQKFYYKNDKRKELSNVVGIIEGKSKKDEYVVFSAHYDHLGIDPSNKKDSIYNGANDDASGVTAVILLAEYYKKLNNNERTLIFVTFTGEEGGGWGSRYFSQQINPEKVIAMFNIEMIGTESNWGKNSAYITGYEKSDFGKILQKNLNKSKFQFYPDPYTRENLFYRSDNATLAYLGVPAHTISTSKMNSEPHYHQADDEVSTLDLANMTEIIKSIALSATSIIKGKDTPSRVALAN